MKKRHNIEQNRVFHLEDSMIMYGVYNVDTLEKLIQMVHKMNNRSICVRLLLYLIFLRLGVICTYYLYCI